MTKGIDQLPPSSNKGGSTNVLTSASSGVDWITATTKDDNVGMSWFQLYVETRKKKMSPESPRYLKGFQGLGTDGMDWLYNAITGWYMIIATSDTARDVWLDVAKGARNITRLDLAVTGIVSEPDPYLLDTMYQSIPQVDRAKRQYALLVNTAGGVTLYVGRRVSQVFGRVYDKGVESESHKPGNRFRWEVEIKKPMAQPVALAIAERMLRGERQEQLIADYVYGWFTQRGIAAPWQLGQTSIQIDVEVKVTTPQKRLAWLNTQVSPTVRELLDLGLGDQVVEALKLRDFVQSSFVDE